MADFPISLRVGEAPVANELDLDKGISSLTGKKLRDRDKFLLDGLQDGAAAPFDLTVNNLTVAGTLNAGSIEFPERALIFASVGGSIGLTRVGN